jgi:predicted NBD/HSP70 family sugar kinase
MATKTVTAGVDLGGTKIQTVAVHGENVVGSARVLTPQTGSPADVIEAIVGTVRASLQAAAVAEADLGGVGIGTPGEIDVEAGAVLLAANVPGFYADREVVRGSTTDVVAEVRRRQGGPEFRHVFRSRIRP